MVGREIRTHGFEPWSSHTNDIDSALVASWPGNWHYWARERTGWLSVRLIGLSRISGHGAVGMVLQWGSTINSATCPGMTVDLS